MLAAYFLTCLFTIYEQIINTAPAMMCKMRVVPPTPEKSGIMIANTPIIRLIQL